MSKNRKSEAGFTLVEVLAALMVFSVAIIGLTHAGTQGTMATAQLETKTLAGIVADNQLVIARADDLKLGTQTGEADILRRRYAYRLQTEATEIADFFKLTVQVIDDADGRVLAERIAYRGQP